MEALACPGQELRDREDLRMELLRLEVRKVQQLTGGGPGLPGTGAQGLGGPQAGNAQVRG